MRVGQWLWTHEEGWSPAPPERTPAGADLIPARAVSFVPEPFDPDQLLQTLRGVVAKGG